MQCVAILNPCKSDSDDTQTLVDARGIGGFWKVNKICNNFSLNEFFAFALLSFQSRLFVKI